MKKPIKVYIAGKITGLERDVYLRNFEEVEWNIKAQGHIALNPTKIVPQDLEYEDQMELCFRLVDIADVVYMMVNWKDSNGARREHAYAESLEKKIVYQSEEVKK